MKKLFKVTVATDIYVIADSSKEAEETVKSDAKAEWQNCSFVPDEMIGNESIPADWKNQIPYGCTEDKKIESFMEDSRKRNHSKIQEQKEESQEEKDGPVTTTTTTERPKPNIQVGRQRSGLVRGSGFRSE